MLECFVYYDQVEGILEICIVFGQYVWIVSNVFVQQWYYCGRYVQVYFVVLVCIEESVYEQVFEVGYMVQVYMGDEQCLWYVFVVSFECGEVFIVVIDGQLWVIIVFDY